MEEIVVYKLFRVFDESIKQKVMAVAWGFPGVTSVKDVEGELGQLEVTVSGEFDKNEMTKELKKIHESFDVLVKDGDDAGSSSWTIPRPYELWGKAKAIGSGAAWQALVIGAGAAKQAQVIGAVAVEQAKVIVAAAAELNKKRKENEEKRKVNDELRRRMELMNQKKKEGEKTQGTTTFATGQTSRDPAPTQTQNTKQSYATMNYYNPLND